MDMARVQSSKICPQVFPSHNQLGSKAADLFLLKKLILLMEQVLLPMVSCDEGKRLMFIFHCNMRDDR